MLEAHHLCKHYAGVRVLDDVSFHVEAGEVVGYLGANGSGKSTTARLLTGLTEPSRGTVTFHGHDIALDLVAYRRRLGYVSEEPHLYTFLSGREYLEFVGRLRQLPGELLARKIPPMLDLLGMSDSAEQDIASYSKGMKQKVLLIAALLHDPDLLILDEPEAGLDVTAALVLRHLVRDLAARGKAVLYSSHVLDVVERMCTRVIVLHHGRRVADGTPAELRTLLTSASLEDVFSRLVLRDDPARTARDIAELVSLRA